MALPSIFVKDLKNNFKLGFKGGFTTLFYDGKQIDMHWHEFLAPLEQDSCFVQALEYVKQQRQSGKIIYPPAQQVFKAFSLCSLDKLKVIILGQDPYHQPRQAMGLAFSVPRELALPRSLRNIYTELQQEDQSFVKPEHGDLKSWAAQGVLLLNSILTVEQGRPQSHAKIGWQQYTDAIMHKLSDECQHLVFMLWGKNAQAKAALIDADKHLILQAAHPSPLSAHHGFFGCGHFLKCNDYLLAHGKEPIRWQLS